MPIASFIPTRQDCWTIDDDVRKVGKTMNYIALEKRELPYEIAEELKLLRTNLLFCGKDKKVIMLTSCVSGEGKSTISLELARSFVGLGNRVLLIDADLRKSVLEDRVVDGNIRSGLTHYLSGQCSLSHAVYATETEGLDVIPAGALAPNPTELISNELFSKLIQISRGNYDYIIVDCAPLGLVVDAAIVAPRCDGAVWVMESGAIKYRFARQAAQKLVQTDCPVLGVVLNKVDRRSGRYGKYYGYGKYGQRYSAYYQK